MAEETLEGTLARPAAVAVHNDGHMLGCAFGVELCVDGGFFGRKFTEAGGTWFGIEGVHLWKLTVRCSDKHTRCVRRVTRWGQKAKRRAFDFAQDPPLKGLQK